MLSNTRQIMVITVCAWDWFMQFVERDFNAVSLPHSNLLSPSLFLYFPLLHLPARVFSMTMKSRQLNTEKWLFCSGGVGKCFVVKIVFLFCFLVCLCIYVLCIG